MSDLGTLEKEFYAKEADRLLSDQVLNRAIELLRKDTVEALVRADATKPMDVVYLQSKITVCDDIMEELKTMILQFNMQTRPNMS